MAVPDFLEVNAIALVGLYRVVVVPLVCHAEARQDIGVEQTLGIEPEKDRRQVGLQLYRRLDEVPLILCLGEGVLVACPQSRQGEAGTELGNEAVA